MATAWTEGIESSPSVDVKEEPISCIHTSGGTSKQTRLVSDIDFRFTPAHVPWDFLGVWEL